MQYEGTFIQVLQSTQHILAVAGNSAPRQFCSYILCPHFPHNMQVVGPLPRSHADYRTCISQQPLSQIFPYHAY